MQDIIQISYDGGVSYTDHTCIKASAAHKPVFKKKVFVGFATIQIVGYQMDPVPDEDDSGRVLARIKRANGDLVPSRPMNVVIGHRETALPRTRKEQESKSYRQPLIPTGVFDGRHVPQQF